MVFRIYVEKKQGLDNEARSLLSEIQSILRIKSVTGVRILNRYDAEKITPELFQEAVRTVFSEPQLDNTFESLSEADQTFAVEYLPGQFDQRADSAAQCIQILSKGERPIIRTAKVYLLSGKITQAELDKIKKYVINPVEAREASLDLFETLEMDIVAPSEVPVLDGFVSYSDDQIGEFVSGYGLAMDRDDLIFCRNYFKDEGRDPTLTEIRVIDTYWSDHCRHTTFHTVIDKVSFSDPILTAAYKDYLAARDEVGRTKPVTLMDIGTIAARCLKKRGLLDKLDESEEINACTVKIKVEINGKEEPWLLLFKNETHNHPTEIEPFGGAATCIGGAIRDPLSGRSYVYAAMRVTGAADPTQSIEKTIQGKLPQRKLVQTAAAGYSSYGNQIGLATGIVQEIYHPGYAAKHMEVGAVLGAAPAANVRREIPKPGDRIILLGGKTGRDGIGGATGSSKAHDAKSVETCGAEVQKGNAPEERKLQRLFRNAKACRMIKRCNDFGAGGVSVAIGELADGLDIDLNRVPKKYEGLDGTELAISESQERMAVVVAESDVDSFIKLAESENLEATEVATVTEEPRLKMKWNGKIIADISREFLDSNGAVKHISVETDPIEKYTAETPDSLTSGYGKLLSDLNFCSQRGLSERFDSTIGRGTVLMPFGGKYQKTPIQAMVHKIPCETGTTDDCSYMAWGYNPYLTEKSPYHGAYLAVVESVSKLIATGASFEDVYLSFQEYFEKPGKDPKRWSKPFSALLGAYRAQMDLGIAAIGGKDSMSGSFEKLDVPPTLISFAVTTGKTGEVISNHFKKAGHKVVLLRPVTDRYGLPDPVSLKKCFETVTSLMREGKIDSCYTPTVGGIAGAIYAMSLGEGLGFVFRSGLSLEDLFRLSYGAFLLETESDIEGAELIGTICEDKSFTLGNESFSLSEAEKLYTSKLEKVYPTLEKGKGKKLQAFQFTDRSELYPSVHTAKPKVLIPVFPGTNCEYDSAKAVAEAGAVPEIFVINNLSSENIKKSVASFAKKLDDSQIVFIPGGFSGGDEPDGSGKFIMAFFRNGDIREGVSRLLDERGGLMCGICNGFQALIKLGLVPYGKIVDTDVNSPTLTFNTIGRHQSKLVRIRVSSVLSPWLSQAQVGEVYTVPISHGEGRFLASDDLILKLAEKGQIATQYVDLKGNPTDDIQFNPNGSAFAIEGITSPDGRVFGKMGHSERIGKDLYQNVVGEQDMQLFTSAVRFFK